MQRHLRQTEAPIDHQHLTGDTARFVGGKKERTVRDIERLGEVLLRNRLVDLFC